MKAIVCLMIAFVVIPVRVAGLGIQNFAIPAANDLRRAVRTYVEDEGLPTAHAQCPTCVNIVDPATIRLVSDVYCAAQDPKAARVDCRFTVDWATGLRGCFVATLERDGDGWKITSAKAVYRKP